MSSTVPEPQTFNDSAELTAARNLLQKVLQGQPSGNRLPGYRELNADEISLIGHIKEHGRALEKLVAQLRAISDVDQRWVSIGATDLQTGLMALTRAVAKPTFF